MNKIIISGRLTRDPELRYTSNGIAVTNMCIACDRPFKNKQGEKETDFIDVVSWQKLAEIVANNLEKGNRAVVDGRLEIQSYEKDGQKRYRAQVVAEHVEIIDWRDKGSNYSSNATRGSTSSINDEDSDLPF